MGGAFRDTLASTGSGGHWYDFRGERIDTVLSTKGTPIKPTVIHARKLDLAPGVTTILKAANREAINSYREGQILAAVKRLPQRPTEPDADWFARVIEGSKEHASSAADFGSELHARVEAGLGDPVNEDVIVTAVAAELDRVIPGSRFDWRMEVPAVSPYGYATRADLWHPGARFLVDIKTKVGPLDEQAIWADHPMQLAATAAALLPSVPPTDCRHAILFLRRDQVEARLVEVPTEDIATGWACFKHLLAFWQLRNRARPSWAQPIPF